MRIALEQCSKCHRQMETDDFAYNADEDFSNPNLDSELLAGFEGKKYYRLCFDCFKIAKQEVGSEISAEEDLEDYLEDSLGQFENSIDKVKLGEEI